MGPCSGFNGFVAFEGIDGSGKTTQIHRLYEWLYHRRNVHAVLTKEPTDGTIGRYINSPERDRQDIPLQDALLFYADRIQHLEELIIPALRARRIVLCDRFSDSTYAYQGSIDTYHGLFDGAPSTLLQEMEKVVVRVYEYQPVVVLLDLDPKIAIERLRKSGHEADDSRLEFFERVREAYLSLTVSEPPTCVAIRDGKAKRYVVVNADQDEDAVFEDILGGLAPYFRQREIIFSPSTHLEQQRYKKWYD